MSPAEEQHLTRAELAAPARTAAQGEPPQGSDDPPVLLICYRAGVIGETQRTVHAVPLLPGRRSAQGMLTALCGAILTPAELEIVAFREGIPCIACVFRCVTDTAAQVVYR
jgi:hypothetical protein